jgi:thioredoxin 1
MKKVIIGLLSVIFFCCSHAQNIAEVNGKKISLKYLQQELNKLPEEMRKNFKDDYLGFLEELISKEVMLQEAKSLKIDAISEVKSKIAQNKNNKDNIIIEELLKREVLPNVQVNEDEMKTFYNERKGSMEGLTYEQMKSQIYEVLIGQKQRDAIDSYISNLRSRAKIIYNDKWQKGEDAKIKNPINEALKNKLPTMVDFGAGTCMPCIQMKPIIAELQAEYKNKANILLIDVNEQSRLTRKYKIMLIPTQIFYDTDGNETNRHIGFFPKDSILINLKKAGLK